MKVRKIFVGVVASLLLLFSGMFLIHSTHAAVHYGTPAALHGKWKSSYISGSGRFKGHSTLSIRGHHVTYNDVHGIRRESIFKTKYSKSGRIYTIVGRIYDNAPAGGIKQTMKIKVYNHHKIYFKLLGYHSHSLNRVYTRY